MNRKREWRIGAGAVLVGFIAVLTDASLPAGLSPYVYVLVLVFAVGIVLVGCVELVEWGHTTGNRWQPTPTESGHRVGVPGDEIADSGASARQSRLRSRVISSLMDAHGCSKSEAEEHVETGTWTDDRIAAAYVRSAATQFPISTRLRLLLRRTSPNALAFRRAVGALRELRTEGDGR